MNFVCAICIDAFGTESDVVSMSCGHCYHRSCIIKWTEQSSTCPSCLKTIRPNEFTKLYLEVDQDQLNISEILNTNDELMENLRIEKLKVAEIETKLAEFEIKVKTQADENAALKLEQTTDKKRIDELEETNEGLERKIEKSNSRFEMFQSFELDSSTCKALIVGDGSIRCDTAGLDETSDENLTDSSVIVIN